MKFKIGDKLILSKKLSKGTTAYLRTKTGDIEQIKEIKSCYACSDSTCGNLAYVFYGNIMGFCRTAVERDFKLKSVTSWRYRTEND